MQEYTIDLLKRRSACLNKIKIHFNEGPTIEDIDQQFDILLKINSILDIIENSFIYSEEKK